MTEENIKCTDSNGKLNIYNYVHCDNDSDAEIKSVRGVIYDKDMKVVVKTFEYTDEFVSNEREKIRERIGDFHQWNLCHSLEGTLLRIYFYDGEWYISTHKKLNAFKSRWSCRDTFGEIFRKSLYEVYEEETDLLADFYDHLHKDRVYLFLLRNNNENRIVCHTHFVKNNERIVYVGYFSKENKFHLNTGNPEEEWLRKLMHPRVLPIENLESAYDIIENLNPFEFQGLIFFHKDTHDQFKIVNPKYAELYKLRDNNPNLRFRYLELRNDPEKKKQLYSLYPRSADIFDEYENILYKIARMIYHYYVSRYIKNKYITLPREEYLIMKKCHDWYLLDRQNNRIFTSKIIEFLNEEAPLNLYKMIRQYMSNHENKKYFNINRNSNNEEVMMNDL